MTKTYHNLQDALDNPLDVLILEMSMNTRISMGLHELESLPRVIGLFQNLQSLHLDGNQLTTLPKEIGQLQNLFELNLQDNKLKTLPKEIEQLQNLQVLRLYSNSFSLKEKQKIQELLPNCEIDFESEGKSESSLTE